MTDPVEGNRTLWDESVPHHIRSEFYDVESFKAGRCSLYGIEPEEVGDVTGKRLLHLQCHFGQDTLSWARRGAEVTGVDFSPSAIEAARALAKDVGIDATFVVSNVYDAPDVVDGEFDVVFNSWGVLTWLPDVWAWARVVAHFVRPGGFFYLAEFHPVFAVFKWDEPVPEWSYFTLPDATRWDPEGGTYAAPDAEITSPAFEWSHPVGDVVTALVDAGLTFEFLHEHPRAPTQSRGFLVQRDDGWWGLPGDPYPLSYSIKAAKPVS